MKPISPIEATQGKKDHIPTFVIEAINELIIEKFDGKNSFNLKKDEVKKRIELKKISIASIVKLPDFESWWLDFEPIYREQGWKIEFDKPGYNESYYESFYRFTPLTPIG